MGRKKIYITEEEREAQKKKLAAEYNRRRDEAAGRDGVSNPCKHKTIKYDGIVIDIGTLDRTKIDTAYIEMKVTIDYTADEDIMDLYKENVHKAFNEWLFNQDMWDRKNRIAIMECAKANPKHHGKYKMFTYQYHIRRDQITTWTSTVNNLMNLVEVLIDTIKKTCVETGLNLKNWAPNAKKG